MNTVLRTNSVINITDIDSDWDWRSPLFGHSVGVEFNSIQFISGAKDDHCVIREESPTGAIVFDVTSEKKTYDPFIKYFYGIMLKPVMVYSEGVYSAGAQIIIVVGRSL